MRLFEMVICSLASLVLEPRARHASVPSSASISAVGAEAEASYVATAPDDADSAMGLLDEMLDGVVRLARASAVVFSAGRSAPLPSLGRFFCLIVRPYPFCGTDAGSSGVPPCEAVWGQNAWVGELK